jgi:hypothetical protein
MNINGDWMLEFLRYCQNMDSLIGGKYKFITFNYDRLWEAALLCAFRDRRRSDGIERWGELCRDGIVHVYGGLDYDVAAFLDGKFSCLNGAEVVNQAALVSMAGGLRLVESRVGESHLEVRRKCAEWLRVATDVVFLGFGFDRLNLERIGWFDVFHDPTNDDIELRRKPLGGGGPECQVYASTLDVGTAELIRMRKSLGRDVKIGGPNTDCLKFLRERCVDWMFD